MQILTADATIIWYTPPQSGHFSTSILLSLGKFDKILIPPPSKLPTSFREGPLMEWEQIWLLCYPFQKILSKRAIVQEQAELSS